jgi:DNA-binding PadR family transcriptional regulator
LLELEIRVSKIKPETFLPLKPHWFHVLLSLSQQTQHGYGIMQDVLERTDGKVRLWPPTLYGTIKRLIDADLIEQTSERPSPEFDDARRRYYSLTPLGRRVLAAECARLEDLVSAIRSKRRLQPERRRFLNVADLRSTVSR